MPLCWTLLGHYVLLAFLLRILPSPVPGPPVPDSLSISVPFPFPSPCVTSHRTLLAYFDIVLSVPLSHPLWTIHTRYYRAFVAPLPISLIFSCALELPESFPLGKFSVLRYRMVLLMFPSGPFHLL